jgi:photosystem II stability/assembly factor-like uncharacterized protein
VNRVFVFSILYIAVILLVMAIRPNETPKRYIQADHHESRQDSPGAFLSFHHGIRTQEGMDAPGYDNNYQLKELALAKKNTWRKAMNARTEATNGVIEWKERGPANVPGRTRALIVDPDDATHKTWFAGSATGGIWKTNNAGDSWQWLTPELPNLATTALVMAPSNHNILYAGTGEGFGLFNGVQGHGIFKSVNRGISWELLQNTSSMQEINRIIVDPLNANLVIAASNNGIYRSVNGGVNWSKVHNGTAQDIKHVPGNFAIQYATKYGQGVIKSIDGGITWTISNTGINANGRVEIDISPVKTDRIFASAQGSLSGSNSDLYVSDNAGASWSLIDIMLSNKILDYLGDQGWYDNTVACDPFDKDIVYVGGIGLYRVRLTNGTSGTAVGSYTMEEVNTATFVNLVNFGADAYQGKLDLGNAANKTNVEIRFGPGISQMAHRFMVPEGMASGVPDANYSYQDYVSVPFQVWDVDMNRQLMVSFRDQDRNGLFDLYELNTENAATSQSREYIFINNVTYDATPNSTMAQAGGHIFQLMYNIWPTLAAGSTWNPNALPVSTLKVKYSELVKLASTSTSMADPYAEYDGKNNRYAVHPDHHNISIIKESVSEKTFRLLIANDGGLFLSNISTSPGIVQGNWAMVGIGFNTSQFYGADKRPGADQYLGGMQDNSTYYSPEGTSATNTTHYLTNLSLSGDGFEAVWNNLDGKKMIGGSQFNNFSRSLDGGTTWQKAYAGLTLSGGVPDNTKFPFVSKLANSKQAPDILYTVGAEGVWKSTDFGGSWVLTPITEKWGLATYIDVEVSRKNANIIWAGSGMSASRGLHVSTDGGKTFSITNNYQAAVLGSITKLASHPVDENTAYALFSIAKSPKILRTANLGQTWEDISGFVTNNATSTRGFPDVAVYCLYVRPDNPNIIWAGTEIGIVETLDSGNSWAIVDDFPNVPVWDMKGQDDQVVIATHGRGIWTATLESSQLSVSNPVISALGTTPQSQFALKIKLMEDFDSTQVWINGSKAQKLSSLPKGEYVVRINAVPQGSIQAKLISYLGSSPVHSALVTGENLKLNTFTKQYFNHFSTNLDLSLNGFSLQAFGNSNTSLKSQSNYSINSESITVIKQPIIISNEYPFMFYRDIAIVEPGTPGSVFGDVGFKDYVIVEATKDGVNWIPISDGYDARFNPAWLSAFTNTQTGNSTMFVDHNIELTSRFVENDTLLFRFKLFSDNTITSWGWAIDDLYIQQKPTAINDRIATFKLNTYPNPNNGSFDASFTLSKPSRIDLTVFDVMGRATFSKQWELLNPGNYTERIHLQKVPGTYLVRLNTTEGQQVQKIIIKE